MKNESEQRARSALASDALDEPRWTFLSNHAHVLVCLGTDPEVRVREMALRVGITERAVTRILAELEEAEVIVRHRVGRRNRYEIIEQTPLRHDLESHANVGTLLRLLRPDSVAP